jgi:hypothetical protein
MLRILFLLVLALSLAPAPARADPSARRASVIESFQGSGDEEAGADLDDAPSSGAAAARGAADRADRASQEAAGDGRLASAEAAEAVGEAPRRRAPGSGLGAPPTRSLSLELGGALLALGGWAYPKIPLDGDPDDRFHAHGAGAAFRLHYDFVAMDLDWRLGLDGALPGYLGAMGTFGVRKDLGRWENPRIVARGGGGLELMVAGGAADSVFLVPVFVAEGEIAVEVTVVPDQFTVGAVFDAGLRYGLPLGLGLGVGGYLRASYLF